MKKNAIIIAGILCVAGASQAQESADRYRSPSQVDTAPQSSTETLERDAHGSVVPPTATPSQANTYDSAVSPSYDSQTSATLSDHDDHKLNQDSDISADSSRRGGSLDAQGHDQDANNDELEGAPDPINPGKQADSSVRGGSVYSREREWNHDSEPTSRQLDRKRHMKADSSIRGGSLEARGGREAISDRTEVRSYRYDTGSRGDFGQGSSATWESDKAHGSVSGSANWNPGDDLLRDGMDVEAQTEIQPERNNDASVGGAASAETGSSTLDDVELDYPPANPDLNSSEQIEENISGEFDLKQTEKPDYQSSTGVEISADPNSLDTIDSSTDSRRSTDIVHDESSLRLSHESDLSSDIERENSEATGAAAGSESGSASSVSNESTFQSNDPALRRAETPLKENDLDYTYRDNRAHGVGSLATGEFGAPAAVVSESASSKSDEELSSEIRAQLSAEKDGVKPLMRSEIARNVQISSRNGEVTLTGTVPTEKDKQEIEAAAAGMAGVMKVNNQLSVTAKADPANRNPDSDLQY